MDYRNSRRFRKFYQDQVKEILGLLDEQYKEGQLDLETHYKIAEQTGQAVDESNLPPTLNDYPYEVQCAFMIHDILPDKYDTNMGFHMGKDWSPINTLLELYEIEDKKITIYFLQHIQARHSNKLNKDLKAKSKSKASSGPPRISN